MSRVARAVVLARGLARRMREPDAAAGLEGAQAEAAAAGLKAMMPVGHGAGMGRPFLDFVLWSLAEAGVREVSLVIGPEHDAMRARYGTPSPEQRLQVDFVVQPEPRGTAHAVSCCESWAAGGAFIVVNADNLYPVQVLRELAFSPEPAVPGFARDALVSASGFPVERVAAFALLTVGADGCLTGIREKPGLEAMSAAGPDALVSMNCWRFDARIFEACRDVPASERGEFELPQAVALAIERGTCFRVWEAGGAVLDLSRRADVDRVSARLEGVHPTW